MIVFIEDVVPPHEFDGTTDDAGRAIGKRVQPRCDSVSEAKGRNGKVIQTKQSVSPAGSGESCFVGEPVGEVDVKPMTVHTTSGGNSKDEIIASRIDRALVCGRGACRWSTGLSCRVLGRIVRRSLTARSVQLFHG